MPSRLLWRSTVHPVMTRSADFSTASQAPRPTSVARPHQNCRSAVMPGTCSALVRTVSSPATTVAASGQWRLVPFLVVAFKFALAGATL
jgi:hypothetical protein